MDFRQTVIKVPALLLCSSPCFVLSSRLDFIFIMAPFAEQDESAAISSPAAHTVFHLMVQGDCLSSSCCICLWLAGRQSGEKRSALLFTGASQKLLTSLPMNPVGQKVDLGCPAVKSLFWQLLTPLQTQGSVPRKEGQWVMRAWARWLQEC